MSLENRIELVTGTIAVIFEPPEAQPTIDPDALTTFMRRPISIGQTAAGLTVVHSGRDQIDVHLGANKLDVRGISGELPDIREKVPKVLEPFLELLSISTIQTYGVNFILEVSPSEPNTWLSSTFLNPTLTDTFRTPVSSTGVVLKYNHAPKEVTLRLDARDNSVLSVNFNASESATSPPNQGQLSQDLEDQYANLVRILQDLGA